MAGALMTITYDDGDFVMDGGISARGGIRKILVDWLSDSADGTVSGTTRKIVGELIKGVTDPGSAAPTDDYDITITDEEGADVLGASIANLTNRDTTNTETAYFNLTDGSARIAVYPVVCDKLTISIAAAGNAKTGQLILYYRPL